MAEEWKDVPGFRGIYQVSNTGKVRSFKYRAGKVLSPAKGKAGYQFLSLRKEGRFQKYVHRLVAETFIGEIPKGHNVNHKDGNKSNNNIDNLEIVTFSENTKHAYQTGLFKNWLKPIFGYKKKSGYIVGEFGSIAEAVYAGLGDKSDISKACKDSKRSVKGILWGTIKEREFEDENITKSN